MPAIKLVDTRDFIRVSLKGDRILIVGFLAMTVLVIIAGVLGAL
jgi:hypothetical protein